VLFLLMIVPVNRLILQPLLSVLDEREARIAGARERADEVARRADETLEAYEARIAEARAEAEAERRGTLDEARSRHAERVTRERGAGEASIAEARAQVASALEAARTQLETQAQDLARQAAERMLGRSL
jgi:F-type H+-transporting ATPase subunit b